MTPHPLITALRRERERQRLTAQNIANRTGYHVQTIRKAETGENGATLAVAEDYANALGLAFALVTRRRGDIVCVPERLAAGESLCAGCGKSYQVRRDGGIRRHACKTRENASG